MKRKIVMFFVFALVVIFALSLVFFSNEISQRIKKTVQNNVKTEEKTEKEENDTPENGENTDVEGDFLFEVFLSDDCFATLVIDDNRGYLKTAVSLYKASGEHVATVESAEKRLSFNLSSYVELYEEYYVIASVWDINYVCTENVSDKKVMQTKYNTCTYCGEVVYENNVCLTPGCPGA